MADFTGKLSPDAWRAGQSRLTICSKPDRIVAEAYYGRRRDGQGRDLKPTMLSVAYKEVHASRGKVARARSQVARHVLTRPLPYHWRLLPNWKMKWC
jgi:hypothetical protein